MSLRLGLFEFGSLPTGEIVAKRDLSLIYSDRVKLAWKYRSRH
jgi:hypothetical protein